MDSDEERDEKPLQDSDDIIIAVVDDDDNIYYFETIPSNDIIYQKIEPDEVKEEEVSFNDEGMSDYNPHPMIYYDKNYTQDVERKEVLCTICGKLVRNIHRHSRVHRKDESLDVKPFANKYPCKVCPTVCRNANQLISHTFTHTTTYDCPTCEFSSKYKDEVYSHYKVHQVQFRYHCQICGKGFLNKSIMNAHEEIHLDIKRYACEFCDKKFAVSRYLYVHRRLNHKKELFGTDETFKCVHCHREFTFESSLRRHLSTIHNIGEDRKVKCPVCRKVIANSYNLKAHLRKHTGEKNYCCEVCGKAFSGYKYYKKHKVTHLVKKENVPEYIDDGIKLDSLELLGDYDSFVDSPLL